MSLNREEYDDRKRLANRLRDRVIRDMKDLRALYRDVLNASADHEDAQARIQADPAIFEIESFLKEPLVLPTLSLETASRREVAAKVLAEAETQD